jgi:hypothetical protein
MQTLQAMGMTVVLAVILAVPAGRARGEDAKVPPSPEALLKALAEAGKPGAEHQKLQPLVGDWTFTLKVWTNPSQSPAELKGTVERKWIMGGRFVQETVRGECSKSGKTFEGLGLLGYDRAQKKFTSVRACGLCGTTSSGLLTCNSSADRFECVKEECCPLTGQKVKGRDEILIESKDRIVTNIYRTLAGKEVKVMEIVAIRKK